MALFEEIAYPFHKPEGQELLRVMVALYRTEREAIALVEQHGIDPGDVVPGLSPRQLWHQLLQMGNAHGVTRAFVQAARNQHPNNPRATFLDLLLTDRPAPVSAEPVDASGAPPPFISGSDKVSEPEALLFFDDLTMPVGKVPALMKTLERVLVNVPSVCLLRVSNGLGEFVGTGFKISATRILTNEHVLFPKKQKAVNVHVDFMFDVDVNGASTTIVSRVGDVATIEADRPDDWGVITVAGMDPTWPIIDLSSAPAPNVGDLTYILQHPGGQRKRLGFVRNTISGVDDRVVHYLTDTEPGSSGAPVFDTMGRCVALHHAGGEPQTVLGKPPVSKNEGIRISRVHAALKAKNLI
jgi:S1-C subfamily serine protease